MEHDHSVASWWQRHKDEAVRDVAVAVAVGILIFAATAYLDYRMAERQERLEQRRFDQAEVLENVRFVRDRVADPIGRKPFAGLNLRDGQLAGLPLGCALQGPKERCADLRGANLTGADLRETDFTGANLAGANLARADLHGAVLSGADLTDAVLIDANLYGAVLTGARLVDANFSEANMYAADLTDTNLTDAVMWRANLLSANLTRANLTGADLEAAHLADAAPGFVYGPPAPATLSEVCYDIPPAPPGPPAPGMRVHAPTPTAATDPHRTVWPEGFTPPHPPVCRG